MATALLSAVAEGTYTAFTLAAGASKMAAVNTDDADTTYISTAGDSTSRVQTFTNSQLPADAGTIFTAGVSVKSRLDSGTNGANQFHRIRYSGTDSNGTAFGLTASYVSYNHAYPNAPGGAAWTAAIVNATEFGIAYNADTINRRVTWAFFQITYEPNAGGFAFLVNGLFPWVALGFEQFAQILAAPVRYGRTLAWYQGHEVRDAFRAYREARRPVVFA